MNENLSIGILLALAMAFYTVVNIPSAIGPLSPNEIFASGTVPETAAISDTSTDDSNPW